MKITHQPLRHTAWDEIQIGQAYVVALDSGAALYIKTGPESFIFTHRCGRFVPGTIRNHRSTNRFLVDITEIKTARP